MQRAMEEYNSEVERLKKEEEQARKAAPPNR
jgi:hypothetical protein